MPQAFKARPPAGRGRKRKLLQGEPAVDDAKARDGELWVTKHAPRAVAELVVHGKKVGDVRRWVESRLRDPTQHGRVLVLTGPSGVGKSAVVRALAHDLGLALSEWTAPAPTPWHEHLHHGFTGHRYASKLDEFTAFVERARKFPPLPTSAATPALLIEDLPHAHDPAQSHQLCRTLHDLARCTSFITVVVLSDVSEERYLHRDAQLTLEAAGATKIVFNPVTTNAIKRLLTRVAAAEKCRLSEDTIAAIAASSGGDVRHAISSLEFQCKLRSAHDAFQFGRDNMLSLYHALGKLLHNKRLSEKEGENEDAGLHERYRRRPLDMEAPERILAEAQIEVPTLTAFLHENLLEFVDEEAVEDVADALTYLGDADLLLGCRTRSSHVAALAAGSVAARGVLFGNSHPAPRRWQSVRAPSLWQVDRLLSEKKVARVPDGGSLRSQLAWEVPSRHTPEVEDEPMDDIRSFVDLDDVDEDVPHSNAQTQMMHVDRRPFLDDDMEEDEDVIEDDDA